MTATYDIDVKMAALTAKIQAQDAVVDMARAERDAAHNFYAEQIQKLSALETALDLLAAERKAEIDRNKKPSDAQYRILARLWINERGRGELLSWGRGFKQAEGDFISMQTVGALVRRGYLAQLIGPMPEYHFSPRPYALTQRGAEAAIDWFITLAIDFGPQIWNRWHVPQELQSILDAEFDKAIQFDTRLS